MRTDLLDAREWAVAEGYADPQRFAIFGGSIASIFSNTNATVAAASTGGTGTASSASHVVTPSFRQVRQLGRKTHVPGGANVNGSSDGLDPIAQST